MRVVRDVGEWRLVTVRAKVDLLPALGWDALMVLRHRVPRHRPGPQGLLRHPLYFLPEFVKRWPRFLKQSLAHRGRQRVVRPRYAVSKRLRRRPARRFTVH